LTFAKGTVIIWMHSPSFFVVFDYLVTKSFVCKNLFNAVYKEALARVQKKNFTLYILKLVKQQAN